MFSDSMATIAAAAIAALVAVAGYLTNQFAARRDRRISVYAEALRALRAYQEVPYRIAKRSRSDSEKREELGTLISESFAQVRFYLGWLQIHSPEVGEAYSLLVNKVTELTQIYRDDAWSRPLTATDSDMCGEMYPYHAETEEERVLCLAAMRADLKSFSRLRMRKVKRSLRRSKTMNALKTVGESDNVGASAR